MLLPQHPGPYTYGRQLLVAERDRNGDMDRMLDQVR